MYKLILLSMAVACHFFNSNLNASTLEDVMDREDKIDRFSSLPAEIKAHIFSLCVPKEKISHRRVCKDWHDHLDQGLSAFFQQPKIKLGFIEGDFNDLMKNLLVMQSFGRDSNFFRHMPLFTLISSTVIKLITCGNMYFGEDYNVQNFVNVKCFPKMKSLEIRGSYVIDYFNITSKRFPKLEVLKIFKVMNLTSLPSNLEYLTHLTIVCDDFTQVQFWRIHDFSCYKNYHRTFSGKIRAYDYNYFSDLDIIDQKFPNLKVLELGYIYVNFNSITSIGKLKNLRRIYLEYCNINDEVAIQLTHAPLTKLEFLSLNYNLIKSTGIKALTNRFHHLLKLDLHYNKVKKKYWHQCLLRARWPHSWQSYHNRYFTAFAGAGLSLFVQPTNDGDPADSRDVFPDLDGLS